MKKILLVLITTLTLAGCSDGARTTKMTPPPTTESTDLQREESSANPTMRPLIQPTLVLLSDVQTSGQSGMASVSDLGEGRTKITITLSGGSPIETQPADIRTGTCARPGVVKFALTNVVNGSSETFVDEPLSSLQDGHLIFTVHPSAKDKNTITACGSLEKLSEN